MTTKLEKSRDTGGVIAQEGIRRQGTGAVDPQPARAYGFACRFAKGVKGRHGSPRKLGHGGRPVGTRTPGATGRVSLEGIFFENAIATVALPLGLVSLNAQTGAFPLGALIVTLMREPAR